MGKGKTLSTDEEMNTPSTITPKVPSAPVKSEVKSGPAEDFLALDLVLMISPEGSTAVRLRMTPFLAVPYLIFSEK